MTSQTDYRMPATGEAWRHYKGGLYTIVGMATDDNGDAIVVYVNCGWSLVQLPTLFTQKVGRFIQQVEHDVPRFKFERERGEDEKCPFISNPVTGRGWSE